MRSTNTQVTKCIALDATSSPITSGLLLGGLQGTRVMEWDGVKIGVMGLVEEEWLKTLATLEPDDIIYIDFVECAQKCCTELKAQGVALIVALTHMRQLNDALLLNAVPEIDLILGGHDHFYHAERHPDHGNLLIKSGTDFRDLTKIRIELNADGTKNYEWEHLFVTSAIEEDPIVKEIIAEFVDVSSHSLSDVIGHSVSELDGRFDAIRSRETNLGNFICDVIREAARSDICFINSGTFRSNRLHAPGPITKRDLLDILPMIDETVVLRLKGSTILEALENSVALYPKHEGRFLQVSGLRFVFDPSQPSHHRILNTSVYLTDSGSPLDPEQDYRVCTKAYLFLGKDGYDMLRDQHVLQDSETAPVLPLYIRWHFMKLDVLTSWKQEVAGVKEGIKRFAHRWRRILADPSDQENPNRSWTALFDQDRLSYVIAPCLENRIVSLHNA